MSKFDQREKRKQIFWSKMSLVNTYKNPKLVSAGSGYEEGRLWSRGKMVKTHRHRDFEWD